MSHFRQNMLIGLIILVLITACQPSASQDEPPLISATAISQELPLPPTSTATPTTTPTPSPTSTASPTATSAPASASEGDRLLTRLPTSPPTPTIIPTNESASTATDTLIPSPTAVVTLSEVDLTTLDESLALLDRLDRREGGGERGGQLFLSGEWSGIRTVVQVGTCGHDDPPNPVTMVWNVNNAGEVTIQQSNRTSWSGKVDANLNISLRKTSTTTCKSNTPDRYENPWMADYNGTIMEQGFGYSITMEATEEWCPPNCVFRVRYDLSKK